MDLGRPLQRMALAPCCSCGVVSLLAVRWLATGPATRIVRACSRSSMKTVSVAVHPLTGSQRLDSVDRTWHAYFHSAASVHTGSILFRLRKSQPVVAHRAISSEWASETTLSFRAMRTARGRIVLSIMHLVGPHFRTLMARTVDPIRWDPIGVNGTPSA